MLVTRLKSSTKFDEVLSQMDAEFSQKELFERADTIMYVIM